MTTPAPTCTVVAPGTGRVGDPTGPDFPRVEVKVGADAGLGFSLVEYDVPAGFSPPPRLHRQTRESTAVYILSGQLHYWFPDGEAVAEAGTLVQIPQGASSRWANDSDQPCRMLAIFAPAGFEQYFLDLAEALAAAHGDRQQVGPAIGRLRQQYGDEDDPG